MRLNLVRKGAVPFLKAICCAYSKPGADASPGRGQTTCEVRNNIIRICGIGDVQKSGSSRSDTRTILDKSAYLPGILQHFVRAGHQRSDSIWARVFGSWLSKPGLRVPRLAICCDHSCGNRKIGVVVTTRKSRCFASAIPGPVEQCDEHQRS